MRIQIGIGFFIFLAIAALAVFLRVWHLDSVPSGFHQDELINTYVGRFIMLHGIDLHGNKWPLLFFDKHGDYPPVIPMYISAMGTFLFGVTVFGARIMTALIGALIIVPVYGIASEVFQNRKSALIAAGMIAITPWHIAFSRIGAEGVVAVTVYMIAIWLMVRASRTTAIFPLVVSVLLLLSTYLLYPAFRITVPITLVCSVVLFWRDARLRFLIIAAVIAALITLYIGSTPWGTGRFNQTSMFGAYANGANPMALYTENEKSIRDARIFDNKLVYFSREFTKQYLAYFSPTYLFVEGGQPGWFAFPNSGLFYLTFLFLLIPIALPFLHKIPRQLNRKVFIYIVALILTAPIAAALTTEFTPNTHRSLILSVLMVFLFTYGFQLLQNSRFRPIFYLFLGVFLLFESVWFFHNYFQHESLYTAILRGDGNTQAVSYIQKHQNEYDRIYMMASGVFPMYYLYQTNNFSQDLLSEFNGDLRISASGNVEFVNADCFEPWFFTQPGRETVLAEKHILVIVNILCKSKALEGFEKIAEIKAADRIPVYAVYRPLPPYSGEAK